MIIQDDTVFVAGLPPTATVEEIADFFGKIGIIKVTDFYFLFLLKKLLATIAFIFLFFCFRLTNEPENQKFGFISIVMELERQ